MLRLHDYTSIPNVYWRKWPNWQAHLELCHKNPDILNRVLNRISFIQLNCREVRTHASHKTTRTWRNFSNRGTKIILLSDELWLTANNFKSFANGSKTIIRNNLGLCKHFEIYLFWNFQKGFCRSNGIKI